MSNALFTKALTSFLSGEIAFLEDSIRAALIHLEAWGVAISAATNASPIVVTTTTPHDLNDGDVVSISGVVGNVTANGTYEVSVNSPVEIELVGSSGNGAYVSGGLVVNLSQPQFLDDIPSSAVVAMSEEIENKSIVGGTAYADPIIFEDVDGSIVRAVVMFTFTGDPSTCRLICYFDRGTGLPLTPNGFPVQLNWNGQGLFALSQ